MRRSYPKKIKSTVDFVQFLSKITWNSNRCFMHASFVLTCLVTQSCLIVIPWTVAFQAPLSLGFSRQENPAPVGADCHFLLQGSPNLAIELQSPVSPALQANSLSTEPLGFGSVGFSSPLILIFHSLFQQLRRQHHQGQLMNIWAHTYKAGLCRPEEEGQEGWEKYTEAKVQRNCGEAALGQSMRIYYFSQPPLPLPDTHFNIAVIDLCMGLGEKVATM